MFTAILYGVAGTGLILSFFKDRTKTKMALKKAWKSFENILPQFLSVLVIIGLALAILTPEQISRFLGSDSGLFGILVALLIGGITLIPGFVAFPLAAALLKNGAGYGQIAAFVSALMMVGVVTIPMEMQTFGKKATLLRNGLALAFSLIAALAMGGDFPVKQLLKRYKVFIVLLLVQIILMVTLPEIGWNSLQNIQSNVKEMLGVIPPVFILLGFLDVWVDRQTMMKYTGPGSGVKGALIGFVLGCAAAGPLYAAFPIAAMMLKKGSSLFNVFLFIGVWSTTKIPMLTFEAGSLGVPFMAARLCMSIITLISGKMLIAESASMMGKEN